MCGSGTFSVLVPGSGSAQREIAKAIKFFNLQKTVDVLIVGRGAAHEPLGVHREIVARRFLIEEFQ